MAPNITALRLMVAAILVVTTTAFLRLLYILPSTRARHGTQLRRTGPAHALIVLGSGGHTAEMLSILRSLDTTRYTPRTYVVSSGDQFSATKAKQFEETLKQTQAHGAHNGHTKSLSTEVRQDYEIVTVGRAREIHQPLYTTPVTALQCLWSCILLLIRNNATPPDIIVTNGPATGVMVVLASLIVRFFGMNRGAEMRSIYVESWARVKTLSLSGKILLWAGLTDRFLVQWEGLKKGRAEWKGFLVE